MPILTLRKQRKGKCAFFSFPLKFKYFHKSRIVSDIAFALDVPAGVVIESVPELDSKENCILLLVCQLHE